MGSSGLEANKTMKASIFSFILASTAAKPQFEALKSVFGSGLEQAPYTTLKEFDGYEMRQYQSVNWVCTEATYKMEREPEMFMKLFRYISGANKEQEEVEMTVPVLSRMNLLADRMVNKQMCFYLNQKHQAKPPTPTDPAVKIVKNDEFTVYAHTFGGYARKDSMREARRFAKELSKVGEEVDSGQFYTASYDSPMKFWNRRNEVMFLVPENDR